MTFDELCSKLDRVQGFGDRRKARCPAHDDNIVSLSLKQTAEGKILLHCFAGCVPKAIAKAINIPLRDLAGDRGVGGDEVARYPYLDRDGTILYEKVRYEPKDFRFLPTGYRGERVPYALHDILDPEKAGRRVIWVEGEKDADVLQQIGFVATTAGGTNDWRQEMAQYFVGRHVTIIPDNDDSGRMHARQVAASLAPVAASVSVCELPDLPQKGDVSDFLKHRTKDELLAALKQAKPFGRATLVPGDTVITTPTDWLWFPRIAKGAITLVFGEAGLGKSTIVLDVIARLSRGDVLPNSTERQPITKSVIVGIEGPISRTVEVLGAAGAALANVAFVKNENLPEPDKGPLEQIEHLEAEMKKFGATVMFVDNVSEAFVIDTETNNEFSVRAALRKMTALAERNGWSIIMISHPKKNASCGSVKEAITGSQAFTNLPRTTLFVAPVHDEFGGLTGAKALAVAKTNLYAIDYINTLEYEMLSHELAMRDGHPVLSPPVIVWKGVIHKDAQRLLDEMRPKKDKELEQDPEGPALICARSRLETITIPEAGMTWEEVVLAVGPGVSEHTLRKVRSAYLTAQGNPRWGVRWFSKAEGPPPPPPSVSPSPIRNSIIENIGISVGNREFSHLNPSNDRTSQMPQGGVENPVEISPIPLQTNDISLLPTTLATENSEWHQRSVNQAQAVRTPVAGIQNPQSSKEREEKFFAAESTEEFLRRMADGGLDKPATEV